MKNTILLCVAGKPLRDSQISPSILLFLFGTRVKASFLTVQFYPDSSMIGIYCQLHSNILERHTIESGPSEKDIDT